jgi:hypothetical protein
MLSYKESKGRIKALLNQMTILSKYKAENKIIKKMNPSH